MSVISKEDAIQECKELGYSTAWPNSCNHAHPHGWEWFISKRPYQDDEYKLLSLSGSNETISREDVQS
jgi:hypothetical protein